MCYVFCVFMNYARPEHVPIAASSQGGVPETSTVETTKDNALIHGSEIYNIC